MTRYDQLPTSDDEIIDQNQTSSLSSLSPPFRHANRMVPDLKNAIRARASLLVSDISGSSLRSSNTNSNKDITLPQSPNQYSSSIPLLSSPSSATPLFHDTQPLSRKSSSQYNEGDSSSSGSRSQRITSHYSTHVRLLRMVWLVTLLVGEHGVYWAMINRCNWPENSSWDNSEYAQKERYRVAIIADPQLTDWMSYHQTGLLLKLVETYTDIFMKRSFHRLHASLRPDAVIFVGDLNDGGRITNGETFERNKYRFLERIFETKSSAWNQKPIVMDAGDEDKAPTYPDDEEAYKDGTSHDDVNITGHYRQLVDVPSDSAAREVMRKSGRSVRLYVAGNHDVGFGDTLIKPAMRRYKQIYGSVNYEVNVGNHSLVVLDTLALSSRSPKIREEAQHFLEEISNETPKLPRILFTHVPLFRLDTTYCGDAREGKQQILNRSGLQYQNMVDSTLSRQILRGIQPDMVFSGDDHDWCEIAHSLDGTLTPEVTLRTFSFAQGTMQPGFVMLSLYNPNQKSKNELPMVPVASGLPVSTGDNYGSVTRPSHDTTFAYEECKQPNQMLIYMCYVALLGISLNLVLIQRFRWIMKGRRYLNEHSLLVQWRDSAVSGSDALPQGSTTATALFSSPQLSVQGNYNETFVDEGPISEPEEQFPNSIEIEIGHSKKT
ncbi:hypothetical protein BGZ46_009205, partial [Entomortierella lignicola]